VVFLLLLRELQIMRRASIATSSTNEANNTAANSQQAAPEFETLMLPSV
jgi:hypothetical protein